MVYTNDICRKYYRSQFSILQKATFKGQTFLPFTCAKLLKILMLVHPNSVSLAIPLCKKTRSDLILLPSKPHANVFFSVNKVNNTAKLLKFLITTESSGCLSEKGNHIHVHNFFHE